MDTTPSKEELARYLDSDVWRWKREAKVKKVGRKCEACGRAHRLHVHHKRYPRVLGNESMKDLEVLCIYCHAERHSKDIREHPENFSEELVLAVLPPEFTNLPKAMSISPNEQFRCARCGKVHSQRFLC